MYKWESYSLVPVGGSLGLAYNPPIIISTDEETAFCDAVCMSDVSNNKDNNKKGNDLSRKPSTCEAFTCSTYVISSEKAGRAVRILWKF